MPRSSRPITVTLGDFRKPIERRVKSGAYASASEVLRALVGKKPPWTTGCACEWKRLLSIRGRTGRPATSFRRLRNLPCQASEVLLRGGKA